MASSGNPSPSGEDEPRQYQQGAYRIIYRVIEPAEKGDDALVRILHVYHGARQGNSDVPDADGS